MLRRTLLNYITGKVESLFSPSFGPLRDAFCFPLPPFFGEGPPDPQKTLASLNNQFLVRIILFMPQHPNKGIFKKVPDVARI